MEGSNAVQGEVGLQHKVSLGTTRSTSSASVSVSSLRSYPTTASSSSAGRSTCSPHLTHGEPASREHRLPIYIRIVPKDVWLRIHVRPTQTIGSIKDHVLHTARAPHHDPSLSYRFYQDAITSSAHAKLAPVTSHDKLVKHRSGALPRSLAAPQPALADVASAVAGQVERVGHRRREAAAALPPTPVPSLPPAHTAHSPRQIHATAAPLISQHHQRRAPSPAQTATAASLATQHTNITGDSSWTHITHPVADATRSFSPPCPSDNVQAGNGGGGSASAPRIPDTPDSHLHSIDEIAVHFDAELVTGNRDAQLEEVRAKVRLSQWNASRFSPSAVQPALQAAPSSESHTRPSTSQASLVPETSRSPAQSYNSTPTVGSSSNFDSEPDSSPRNPSSFRHDLGLFNSAVDPSASAHGHRMPHATTPPRRPPRADRRSGGPAPAIFYTQPGACESFNSLASLSSPSFSELVTTADDDASVMQWGTQAEPALSDEASPSRSLSSAIFSPLSSPLQASVPSTSASPSMASSPIRPRSRTVTAADVMRARARGDDPPPMPETVSSPVRISSLPQPQSRKLVAESSQRRGTPSDLLELLKGSPDDQDDQDLPTMQRRRPRQTRDVLTLHKKASDGSSSGAMGDSTDGGYLAGIRLNEISRGCKQPSHPLSSKFAVLSAANGCELEEWKTVAAYRIRPYELLELQWAIPTERVYIAPTSLQDIVRAPAAESSASGKGLFKQTWGEDVDAGPDRDAVGLEPYFEGWVYVLKGGATPGKADRIGKNSSKMGKWKLHWMTVKGWRIDLYRKKPRAGEAVLPVAEKTWSLRSVAWVVESDNPIPSNAALPALDTIPAASITVAFPLKSGNDSGAAVSMLSSAGASGFSSEMGSEVCTLTLRCISRFDHEAITTVLLRAWFRCSTRYSAVDIWRRKALFRAVVAGRGGTVAAGRAGRGRGGRNAKARSRLRPSGWPKEWENADQWSSESEREEIAPPPELEQLLQQRRDTMTQSKANSSAQRGKKQEALAEEKGLVPNGLYAALLGRRTESNTPAAAAGGMGTDGQVAVDSSPYRAGSLESSASTRSRILTQSPSLPNMEPGIVLSPHSFSAARRNNGQNIKQSGSGGAADTAAVADEGVSQAKSAGGTARRRSGSLTRSPNAAAAATDSTTPTSSRSRSLTVSNAGGSASRGRSNPSSSNSSRNVSREASPRASGSRKASGHPLSPHPMAPALVPGYMDVAPPASVMLLKRYKASQKANLHPS